MSSAVKIASKATPSFLLEKEKQLVVDIRQDNELEVLLQIAERRGESAKAGQSRTVRP